MLFSSVTFLFIFLPAVVCGYYILPKKFRNFFLLLASLFFYAFGEPKFLILMLIIIIANYSGAILMYRFSKIKKLIFVLTILIDLLSLFYFKYVDFLIYSFNSVFKTNFDILHIALPLGISFYTFQAISYISDIYKGSITPQKNFYKLALYITLFPQLIAGPIIKYHDIANQIDNRQENLEQFYYGLRRFIIGLSRKVLIADTLMLVVNRIIDLPINNLTTWESWVAVICYAFQIYNDFGGYSDMAIGLCAMFGFKINENFNFPFLSQSYTEFWHRWHISLGLWVKEYIYIPLGGNRCKPIRHYFNLFLSFFIIGIWHGANMNMIMLGLYNAVLVILEKITGWNKLSSNKIIIFIHYLYMIPVLSISYFFLRSPNFKYTVEFLKRLFGITQPEFSIYKISYYITNVEILILIIAFLGAVSLFKNILVFSRNTIILNTITDVILILMLFLSILSIAASTYNPFLYFRF